MAELESMVDDLLRGGRDERTAGLLAKLASALETGAELEIFVPCAGCSAPVQLRDAHDGHCRDCRTAA
jgi:hypothetical protein